MYLTLNSGKTPGKLSSIFLRWLLLTLTAGFAVLMFFSWNIQTRQSDENTTILLHNIVENIIIALDNMHALAQGKNFPIDEEYVAEFYGSRIQTVKDGGIIIVEDNRIIGDAIVEYRGLDVTAAGISHTDIAGNHGVFHAEINGEPSIAYYKSHHNYKVIALMPNRIVYMVRNTSVRTLAYGYLLLFAVLFAAVSLLLKYSVIDGIGSINVSLEKITAGELDVKAEVTGNLEFALLSSGINTMVGSLKKAIAAEATRIDNELRYAKAIQKAALANPSIEKSDPHFRIAAGMHAAKEVGGDFYDFFPIDCRTAALVIADVSDKGIPAALYMMSVMNKVRSALQQQDPEQAFFLLNNELCAEGSEMFLTLFAAIVDLESGDTLMINAGHNSPLLSRDGKTFDYLDDRHNFVMGGMPGVRYQVRRHKLNAGDILFTYTDGVTECTNALDKLFGEERLKKTLDESPDKTPEALMKRVMAALKEFAEDTPQSDDITILAFQRISPVLPVQPQSPSY